MPRYVYEAYDPTGEEGKQITTGTVVCENDSDLASNLGLMGLQLKRFKIADMNANPEPAQIPKQDGSNSPVSAAQDQPAPPAQGVPVAPKAPAPRQQFQPPQPPQEPEIQYVDNDVKYMVKGGKLFKEDWIECDKTRFRVIKVSKDGKRTNITDTIVIEKLDWKELAR